MKSLLLALTAFVVLTATAHAQTPSACKANELSLTFDGENGSYNGMSHSGVLLVLRNIGPSVCTVPQRPQLRFTDAAGKHVALRMHVPPGMHPGPVMLPVAVPPGAEATGDMRWVSGDAYGAGNCVSTRAAVLTVGAENLQVDFAANICAAAKAVPEYEQKSLQRDAPYVAHGAVR